MAVKLTIKGAVPEVPPRVNNPERFDPVWKAVADANTGLWVSVEASTAGGAHGLKKAAEKRGLEAERRKCMVFIRRKTSRRV